MTKLDELIKVFSGLQGIGKKSAIRIAFDVLAKDKTEIENIIETIKTSCETIKPCTICSTLTDLGICEICSNKKRNKKLICLVENTRDVFAFENAGGFNGLYHVLGGKIDPLNGIGIDKLNIKNLLERLDNVEEIILALNPDIEGETTTLYLTRILSDKNIRISKIASGIPMGGNIEYTDMMTLVKSLEGRQEIKDE
ncbi:recombination mediator RecR [Oceanivirga salmonicida]|uniref:recombination mediator RecR n=1 Tax=Oceanivirga salmonicida TaxID=1769291 RepID=UPI0008364010|nr:recombination mediator RecR [Oceanivirga salmonicida]